MFKTDVQKLRNALEFTRVYKENANDIYLREAVCMDFQLRHILVPMDENDGIAAAMSTTLWAFPRRSAAFTRITLTSMNF